MFVKKWHLEYQKVIKTYLHTYLRDSSDSSDSSESSYSSDGNDSSDQTTLYTKKFNLPSYLCDSSYSRDSSDQKKFTKKTFSPEFFSP